MAIENNLWVEKYRPSCVEDCVLPENIKGVFRSFIKEGEILNLMLTGTQGTGKTSIAKAICKELDADVLFIDASSEGGKQAIIDKIIPFASTVSIDKSARQKVVILDECIHEDETVRIGTVESFEDVPIKQLVKGVRYPIVNFNRETGELENDYAQLTVDKEAELFEVELEDGTTIVVSENHPFIICDEEGKNTRKVKVCGNISSMHTLKTIADEIKVLLIKSVCNSHNLGRVMDITSEKNGTFITSGGIITSNCDGLTQQAQQALRPNIEALSGVCRFIMTANYPAKIIPALKSRCKCFDFSYTQEQKKELMVGFYKRCAHILEDNSVPFDKKLLAQFISTNFPDFRSIVNTLQTCAQTHGEINESILTASSSEIASVVYPAILSKNFDTMRKVIHELSYSSNDVFSALFERLDEYIKENHHKPAVICILADYQDKASRVAIPELNLVACCVEIASVL